MEKKNKKYMYVIMVIIILLIITIGVSYALWIMRSEQKEENILSTSCLNVTMEEELNNVSLNNTIPISDEEGLGKVPFSFKIKNNCEEYADYTINLEMLSETTLNSEYVKIALSEKGTKGVATKLNAYKEYKELKRTDTKEGRQIKKGKLKPSEERSYELRIWLDEDVTKEDNVEGSIYKSKVVVESVLGEKPYTESILNGTDPVLDGGLIPIKINEENGKVTRADETEKWYSYSEQQWANAVILRDGVEDPGANEPIDESDIESYFVWIPRYRYEIFNEGNYNGLGTKENNAQIIKIEFENKDIKPQSGSKKGEWLTHPAFTSFNTNGIWVGKFETGYDGAENTKAAEVNPTDEKAAIEATSKVIIKPNVYSWRGIQVAKAYTIGRYYEATLNSHMIKNMEWGAAAYLSQSKYGVGKEVRINNNSYYLTGYAGKHEPTTGYTGTDIFSCTDSPNACNERSGSKQGDDGEYNTNYFNKASVVASTTGNYTGIFDMSGGTWEYTMSGMDDGTGSSKLSSGRNDLYNSGFNGILTCPLCDVESGNNTSVTSITNGIEQPTDERYFDEYAYSLNNTTYNRGFLGDGTKELGPFATETYITKSRNVNSWYDDESWIVNNGSPWGLRSGCLNNGIGSGVLTFNTDTGASTGYITFRLVLAF